MKRFLTEGTERLVKDERQCMVELRSVLARADARSEDLATLDRTMQQLDELFLLVVVGEFNSGKSAFINALLGHRLLAEGVTPTTTQVHLVGYGDELAETEVDPDMVRVLYPLDWLRDINLLDTPGTNSIDQRHQEIAENFVPRADLILFLTSADRPFSESERLFLKRIRDWGKKVVIIINKIDILETEEDLARVCQFVDDNAQELLGRRPAVFPVSARLARQAKQATSGEARARQWAASRFEPLETYILISLDERERLRLKLASPLGIAQRLAERCRALLEERRQVLSADVSTIRTIEADVACYESDMRSDFKYRMIQVDNVLYAMSDRGDRFLDETITLRRLGDLLKADRVRAAFDREVVADTSAEIERLTDELIDWLVQAELRQWQAAMGYLGRRLARREQELVGEVEGNFHLDRRSLLESVGRSARETIADYDRHAEAKELADAVRTALAQTALVEVGAIGLGAVLVKLLATTLADVSGIAAAGAVAAFGFYILPYKRRRAHRDLVAKIARLRERLNITMGEQFERELSGSIARLRVAISPYTRFVHSQQDLIDRELATLDVLGREFRSLAKRVDLEIGSTSMSSLNRENG